MIKCDKGTVTITGTGHVVLAEVSMLVHSLYQSVFINDAGMPPEKAKQVILDAVEDGFKSPEEIMAGMDGCSLIKALDMLKEILTRKDDK